MESEKGDVLEEGLLGKEDGEARNRVGIDEMLQKWVGEFGHWQLRHFVLTSLAWALEALLTMVMIFADRQPDWQCAAHATSCNPRGSVCSMESGSWEWTGGRAVSTVSEWGLICRDKIGRQVSRLKGHSSKQIRSMAELFLRSWENLVDEWMKTAGDVATAGTSSDSVSGEGIDKENGLPAPPLDEGAFFSAQTTSIEMSQFFDGMDDDRNPQIALYNVDPQIGRALQEEENDPNETDRENNHFANQSHEIRNKKSGVSRTLGQNMVKAEFRSRDHFQRHRNHQSSQLNGSALKNGSRDSLTLTAANSGPRRPQNGAVEHRDHRNNVKELTHKVKNEMRPGSFPPQSKSKSSENASVMDNIEASKRSLQKGYQQAENGLEEVCLAILQGIFLLLLHIS